MIGGLSEHEIASFLDRAVDAGNEPLLERPFVELADRWRSLGLLPGDLVLLSLPTGVALLQHFFAVLAAGGVPALLAPGAPSARLRETATVMGARVVAAVRLPASGLSTMGAPPPNPGSGLSTMGAPPPNPGSGLHDGSPAGGPERVEPVGGIETAWFASGRAGDPLTRAGEVVLLTSGTSGFASGCVTSIEAMLRNGQRHADSIGQRSTDTVLVSLPLHFSFALVAQALGTLGRGGTLVIGGPPFHPEVYARMVAARGVTVSALTPIQVRTLLQRWSSHGADGAIPASLRVLSVGGDSLAAEHVAELLRRRPDGELYLTYGLTQAGPRVSTLAAHSEPPSRYASVGRPIAGTQATLADLGDGSGRTELLVSSDTLMRRRIGLVEGRRGDDFRAPGVLATGDVFTQDDEGYLYYRGRLAEYILRGGEKVSLATVRRLATQLPGVVAARTRVETSADGEDFDLTLVVADTLPRHSPDQYRAFLAKSVRRGELPRTINVVDHTAQSFGYK